MEPKVSAYLTHLLLVVGEFAPKGSHQVPGVLHLPQPPIFFTLLARLRKDNFNKQITLKIEYYCRCSLSVSGILNSKYIIVCHQMAVFFIVRQRRPNPAENCSIPGNNYGLSNNKNYF